MSVARLLLSGLMVASGLILAAFTLHGTFDTRWPLQAFNPRQPPLAPWATQISRASEAQPPDTRTIASDKARKRTTSKRRAAKRAAEKAQNAAKPPTQQAAFWWPWKW